jgi:hypothetical protein
MRLAPSACFANSVLFLLFLDIGDHLTKPVSSIQCAMIGLAFGSTFMFMRAHCILIMRGIHLHYT